MYYGNRVRGHRAKWRAMGEAAYAAGRPLEANPYKAASHAAQVWAEGWGDAFADAHPLAAADD